MAKIRVLGKIRPRPLYNMSKCNVQYSMPSALYKLLKKFISDTTLACDRDFVCVNWKEVNWKLK